MDKLGMDKLERLKGPGGWPALLDSRPAGPKTEGEKLCESGWFLYSVLESLGDAVVVIDRDMRILFANQGYRLQSKRASEEILGQYCYRISHGYSRPCHLEEGCVCVVMESFRDGRSHTAVHIHQDREGRPIYVETCSYPLRNEQGRVCAVVETLRDITAIKNLENEKKVREAEVYRLAFYDPLTGLVNRRLLLDRLERVLAAASHSREHGAVLSLDIDRFKMVNDIRGHHLGDLLLQEMAGRLQAVLSEDDRAYNTLSRQGGDEFVVLLHNLSTSEETAVARVSRVAGKIHLAMKEPFRLADCQVDCEFHLTVSIGAALFCKQGQTAADLLKYADTAMHQAKEAGRNALRIFDPAMQTALEQVSTLEHDLRLAIREEQFQLHYQPQFDGSGRIIGCETLLRWFHPSRGPVSPAEFIPLAEENGLILPLGRWVLRTACERLKAWQGLPGAEDLRLAVNISARQFHQPDFVAEVRAAIAAAGIEPARLTLELTETLVLADMEDAIRKMRELKADGLGLSMDDFGTGYSSLAQLKHLPLGQLKIDGSFIRDLGIDPYDGAIVQAIIAMGHTLGFEIIAEGVETAEQLALLQGYGCKAFQGYLFSMPLPAEQLERLLQGRDRGTGCAEPGFMAG